MTLDAAPPAVSRSVAWIGGTGGAELAWVRSAVGGLAAVTHYADVGAALESDPGPPWPALLLLASDTPARWTLPELTALARRWPLAPLVSIGTTLVDGRRRSGPQLPGTTEVPWCEVPVRLAWWLADLDAGRPGTLGLPATARREERALEAVAALRPPPRGPARVSVAAERPADLEGVADLVAAAGRTIERRICGRPPLDEPAEVLVWDTVSLGPSHLAWLRMLLANRPGIAVIVVDSFPRVETALPALGAGAAAVLGRPLSPESLAGAFVRLEAQASPSAGLGRATDRR